MHFSSKLLAAVLLSWAIVSAAYASAAHFVFDLSASNPLVESEQYASNVADRLEQELLKLPQGTYVRVETFGALGLPDNLKRWTTRITRKNSPQKVAPQLRTIIKKFHSGEIASQGATNIVSFLEFGEFNCADNDTIFLVTDGIEFSEYVPNTQAFVEGKASLPEPEKDLLDGCSLTFIGLGQRAEGQLLPSYIKNIRSQWRSWCRAAGATFRAIVRP